MRESKLDGQAQDQPGLMLKTPGEALTPADAFTSGDALVVQVQRLDQSIPLPEYAYPGDAGLDLRAACDCSLKPQERILIPTGLRISLPKGYAGFILPRSGLAIRQGLSLVNTPGLIDSDYRGEITVVAINHDQHETIELKRGDRIAQMVIMPYPLVQLVETGELDSTLRNQKGFGSSG